jgi:sensor histidine kinase YesM
MSAIRSARPACDPAEFSHPLEIFPVFRRWRGGHLRNLIYTLVWNTLIAVIITGFALLFDSRTSIVEIFVVNFVFAQCMGLIIHGLFMIGDRVFPGIHKKRLPIRFVYYATLPIIGVILGYGIGAAILGYNDFFRWVFTARGLGSIAFVSIVISSILLTIFIQRERAARAEAAVAQEKARAAAAEREVTTARLKLLEAQVEPHFLYNTLAHVVSLIDADPAAARRMTERLIELLRATAAAPDGTGTLAEQLRWLRAYLEILQVRMGGRLAWRIDVPPDLLPLRVPPMVLQPIVENAVKHGLEPKIEGGRLEITARREADGVRLVVRDTGLGFRTSVPQDSDSLGLANLRARLTAWYGQAARVLIEDNAPAGACVSIVLPAAAS